MVKRMIETFAVALIGDEDRGWLVDATSADEALSIVHGTEPRAHEVWLGELLVWNANYYRTRHLADRPYADSWTRLTAPPPCPACAKGVLADPGGVLAGLRCMVEIDAGTRGLVLEAGCGYRPGDTQHKVA